jgi:hypothetical protein
MEEIVAAHAEEAQGEDREGEQEEAADLAATLDLVWVVPGLRWSQVCDGGRALLYSMIVPPVVSSAEVVLILIAWRAICG